MAAMEPDTDRNDPPAGGDPLRAELNLRFHPLQDPHEAWAALVDHLSSLRPSVIPLTVTPGDTGPGYEAATGGPGCRAMCASVRAYAAGSGSGQAA